MPTQVNNLKVFVASPSDVVEERKVIGQVIEELNKLLGAKLNLRLELVQWESDSYPGIGEDPQSVINRQIGDDYDIFIGILWKRFGTPTKRDASGTVEEFNRAYERARENTGSVHVMFYFNDSPIPISELDIQQVSQIKEFQANLGEKGVYYFEYKSPDEFEKLVRMHLSKVMQNIEAATKVEVATTSDEESPLNVSIDESESEEGFLDLVISTVDEFQKATETIKHIGELMDDMRGKLEKRVNEINSLPQPYNPRQAKAIIDGMAGELEDYVERTKVELPILSKAFQLGIDAYTKSAQLMGDFDSVDNKQIEDALSALEDFRVNNSQIQESTKRVRDAVQRNPRMTTKFNHAKRHVLEVLDDLLEEYRSEENLTVEAQKVFQNILNKRQ